MSDEIRQTNETEDDFALNVRWRIIIGPRLDSKDRRVLSERFGVSRRTVERWTSRGAQRLSFVVRGKPERREFARLIVENYGQPSSDLPRQETISFLNIADVHDYLEALQAGEVRPWLRYKRDWQAGIERAVTGPYAGYWVIRLRWSAEEIR